MSVSVLKNYVGGKWVEPENYGLLDVDQPSTAGVIARVPLSIESVGPMRDQTIELMDPFK